jgi:hypothetical protein
MYIQLDRTPKMKKEKKRNFNTPYLKYNIEQYYSNDYGDEERSRSKRAFKVESKSPRHQSVCYTMNHCRT